MTDNDLVRAKHKLPCSCYTLNCTHHIVFQPSKYKTIAKRINISAAHPTTFYFAQFINYSYSVLSVLCMINIYICLCLFYNTMLLELLNGIEYCTV